MCYVNFLKSAKQPKKNNWLISGLFRKMVNPKINMFEFHQHLYHLHPFSDKSKFRLYQIWRDVKLMTVAIPSFLFSSQR